MPDLHPVPASYHEQRDSEDIAKRHARIFARAGLKGKIVVLANGEHSFVPLHKEGRKLLQALLEYEDCRLFYTLYIPAIMVVVAICSFSLLAASLLVPALLLAFVNHSRRVLELRKIVQAQISQIHDQCMHPAPPT